MRVEPLAEAVAAFLRDYDGHTTAVTGTRFIADGQFHHVIVTRDLVANEVRLYIDGTRDAVVTFYRNFYHPGNTVLTIVGDVDPDDATPHGARWAASRNARHAPSGAASAATNKTVSVPKIAGTRRRVVSVSAAVERSPRSF